MKIVILARKNLQYNTRVERQAKALTQAGHEVRIVTLLIGDQPPLERKNGYEIIRLKLDPLHHRIPRNVSRAMGAVIRGIAAVERLISRFLRFLFLILQKLMKYSFSSLKGVLRFAFIKPLKLARGLIRKLRGSGRESRLSNDDWVQSSHGDPQESIEQTCNDSSKRSIPPEIKNSTDVQNSMTAIRFLRGSKRIAQATMIRFHKGIQRGLTLLRTLAYRFLRITYQYSK
jgi:hypothetical protein